MSKLPKVRESTATVDHGVDDAHAPANADEAPSPSQADDYHRKLEVQDADISSNANDVLPQCTPDTSFSSAQDERAVTQRTLSEEKAKSLLAEAKILVQSVRRKSLSVTESDVFYSEAIEKQRIALDLTIGASHALAEYGATLLSWARSDLNGEFARDRLEESSRSLALALEKTPSDEVSLFNRGLCICLIAAAHASGQGQGLYAEACRMYDKLLELNPSSRIGAFNCGLAYISRARLAETDAPGSSVATECYLAAKARFQSALALQPDDGKASAYLVECDKALRPPTLL
jgi:tetratricopeptide (TPR) repeat protein